jgi:hypothetical protein
MRTRGTTPRRLEEMGREIAAGRAEMLIGVCVSCADRPWFPVDDVGESCPADITEHREHAVNYYTLVGVKRRVELAA